MATFKELTQNDFKIRRSFLDQIVDVIQEDISGSATRQKYQVFVTGGVGPGVTSSLHHTVHDQDFSLQTANPIFDITMGLYVTGTAVDGHRASLDSNGKALFASGTMMMREKTFMYQQHAQKLLGDADGQFVAPFGSSTATDNIDAALFIDFKRLFHRDQMKRETFVMALFATASIDAGGYNFSSGSTTATGVRDNRIYTDIGASSNKETTFGGQVSDVVNAADTTAAVGLLFNDAGILVLDMAKVFAADQHMFGVIDAMNNEALGAAPVGQTLISASFYPDFVVSASIDDILDHVTETRFGSGTNSAMVYENITNINSSLITTQLGADEFNYSSNPTYVDSEDRIVVIDEGQEETQKSFTMVTTIGFYDANDNLLAVSKFSRPVEKSDERPVMFTTRLDY
jgi:hypothetical protein